MRVRVDVSVCIASGACVLESPLVFDQDDDGLVVVLQENPGPELHESVRQAMASCPAAVIEIDE